MEGRSMTRQRILFVDDDPNVLGGLSSLLRKDRRRWDIEFAESGEAAFAMFASGPFDAIVCDMRMPGMDGAALLQRVKWAFPETTRIVLSGQADRDGIIRALPVTHQFLSKPCDADVLRGVLERVCGLQTLLVNDTMRKIIGRVHRLPSEPSTYWELVRAAERQDVSTADVAAIVERDPAMSAKVLQLVNSAYFGLVQRVTSIAVAITYIGIDLLKALTLSTHVFKALEGPHKGQLTALQNRSLMTARLAHRFASDAKQRDEAFSTAIVHDVGEVVLAYAFPERFLEMIRVSAERHQSWYAAEPEFFGTSHAEVGAYLLGIWGLPISMIEVVAYHHEPRKAPVGNPHVLAIVHAADILARRLIGYPDAVEPDMDFLQQVGLAQRLPEWESIARDLFDHSEARSL
jgi:HD-like signal output (HDOD) protein